MFEKVKKFFKANYKFFFLFLIIFLILFGFYFWEKEKFPKPGYIEGYRLVPEKISQSAKIPIFLPPGIDKEYAKRNIKFEPEIKGNWVKERGFFVFAAQNVIYFQPSEKLELNHHYLVQLTTPKGEILREEFLAVENPEIIAIFPKEGSEAPENSEITIVFNRPMVPLTTLGYFKEKEVPVEIFPKTEGHFKWITTKNLQFIPKERLKRSSNYTVKVKDGLVSMDGLPVKGKEIKFSTRHLRYLHLTEGKITYNQPISIYFNQPVDLEKTKKEIKLINDTTGKEVPFIAEYGKKTKEEEKSFEKEEVFGKFNKFLARIITFKKEKREEVDQSIINIYPKKDRFGREKLWDFENSYTLIINKAYPTEGDIILDEKRETNVFVAPIIENVWAESERTNYASLDFFDPKGKLWVSFYEEIDLTKSKISTNHLKEIGYGEKCKKESEICEKIQDKKKIYLIFKSEEVGLGEKIEINFEKITNVEGLVINKEPIKKTITSFPKFQIFKTSPAPNSSNADLTRFIFCSNSQISAPPKEEYKNKIKANLDFEINFWGSSWRVKYPSPGEICAPGEFHTEINYGLMPLSDYFFEFDLEDVFGQKLKYSISFSTGQMPGEYLNFYHLQPSFNVTTPQKTTLTFATKNFEYVNLEICKLDAQDFLYYLRHQPEFGEPTPQNRCQKIVGDKIELPKKYWIKNYFKIDLKKYFEDPIGNYILTLSNPNYIKLFWEEGREVKRQVFERTYLNITNLGVAEKKIQLETSYYEEEKIPSEKLSSLQNLYWITDISSLEPVSGAKIELYKKDGSLAGIFYSDENGIAKTPTFYDLAGAIISKGKDSTIIPSYQSKLEWVEKAFLAKKIYLYTDKPIYRPTQQVFVKGIYRIGYDGAYEIDRSKKINLKVYNSRDEEILSRDLEVNDFGTFNTDFILERNAPLGTYRICADGSSCTYIDVQEYIPAPFEVTLKTDKDEYISKDKINLEVEARYYFGVPLEGGEVEYTISSQNYYFDRYQNEYFEFDREWYYLPSYNYGEKFLLRGKTSLSTEGKAKISQELDLEKLFKEKEERKSKIIVVDVTVKNLQGQSVSAQKSFILHQGEFYLSAKPDKYFVGKDEKFNLRVKSVDTQGKEIKVSGINLELYKIDWIFAKRQEAGGNWVYKWEKKRELVDKKTFDTDEKGNFVLEMKIDKEGEYEFEVSAKDKRGNLVWNTFNFYVYGTGEVTIRPTKDTNLEIETEKVDLNVGEEAKIIIKSPYPRAKALISIERGKIFDYEIREIIGNLYHYSFKIKEDYIPNIFVSVLLQSSQPEVKFGKVEFHVGRKEKEIDIEVKSNKKYYLPGEEVTLDIFTKDKNGNPLSTELSISVVDMSVLALKGNPKKNPLMFFYQGFPLTVQTSSNIKNILVELEIPTKGGGGLAPEMLVRKVRGIFKETAFWQAVVRTDESGFAQVKFTLPDNLTTWQVETLGVTKDTKLGVDYQEFITKKDLMLVPLKPRFVVPGDEFFVGAQIFNQTKETQEIKVKFESQTLLLKDENEKKITLNPGKTQTVYFKVEAPKNIEFGEHQFLLSAKTNGLEDTVIQYLKITPNNTYEVTATANYTSDLISKEYIFLPEYVVKDKGNLSIKSSATLAVFLSDALNYLIHFPYSCSEQIASQLNAIAIVKRGLNLPNVGEKFKLKPVKYEGKEYSIDELVKIGLSKLYNNQQFDGGFSFWKDGESNFYLTLHVVNALNNLSLAGYEVNKTILDKAVNYLYQKITTDENIYQDKNNLILTAYALSNLKDFSKDGLLKQKIIEIINNDLFLKEKISNTSLSYLAILMAKGDYDENLKKKVFDTLDNRIDIDSRGAFLAPNENFLWYYYETPVKDTALYLKAQVARKSENPILEKVLRWILNSKEKDGSWGSTNNTLAVIDTLTDFLEWKRETESNFKLEISINKTSQGSFHFNPETILEQFQKEIPLKELKFNQINTISFKKENLNNLPNNFYYDLALKYYLPAEKIPPRDEGFSIERKIFALDDKENENPLSEAKVGDVLRVNLKITVPEFRKFVAIEDYIPAGMEIVNLDLATEQKSLRLQERELENREFVPDFKELRDDRAFFFKKEVSPGVYEIEYFVRALVKGKFAHLPAVVSEMYFPENFGRTSGGYFEIK